MKTEYDISTKEKEISYLDFVDDILYSKLGLKPANSGSRYLKELIIYIYEKNVYEFMIEREIKKFIIDKKMNTNFRTIKSKITYAINNGRRDIIKENFYYIFKTDYDSYFISIKNIVNAIMIMLENNYKK